jgi:hypothetical protein
LKQDFRTAEVLFAASNNLLRTNNVFTGEAEINLEDLMVLLMQKQENRNQVELIKFLKLLRLETV